jgi:hypothetical protein
MNTRSASVDRHRTGSSRLTRRLVELGEYAKREGVTPADVTRCSEIGIIQLRRNRGRTFVVDMPVCSYDNTDEIDAEVAELIGLTRPRGPNENERKTKIASQPAAVESASLSPAQHLAAKLVRTVTQALPPLGKKIESHSRNVKGTKATQQQPASSSDCPPVRFEQGSIKQLVQEMLRRAEEIKAQDAKTTPIREVTPVTNASRPVRSETCQMTEELLATMHQHLDQFEKRAARQKTVRL